MTFIASVIAKKGVAIIADSLVTSMTKVIEIDDFYEFISEKSAKGEEVITLEPPELMKLFKKKPSHTKDFEEKLFEFDKFTAITTAGNAAINSKRIEQIVKEFGPQIDAAKHETFEAKVLHFSELLNKEVIEHLKANKTIGVTRFIITHYDVTSETTEVYRINTLESSYIKLEHDGGDLFEGVTWRKMESFNAVVCDGQNRISERILFGHLDFFLDITPKVIEKVIGDFKIPPDEVPENYYEDFFKNSGSSLLSKQFFDDMKVSKLAELSLQQAVDLASLLMKIEIQFQKYTENIPTVGGVIKLAVIDKDGFRFIQGVDLKSETIH